MKKILFTLSMLLVLLLAVGASADTIGFEAEIHTGNYYFTIHNSSSPGIYITQVYVELGDNMQFDTADPVDKALGVAEGVTITKWVDGDWTTQSSATVGYTGTLSTDVADGGTSATLSFNDFASEEAWGFYVDFDSLTGNTTLANDMANALITVSFADAAGNPLNSLTFNYDSSYSGKKVSFPSDLNADSDPDTHDGPSEVVVPIPEPVTMLLFGSGLIGMAGIIRRRFKK